MKAMIFAAGLGTRLRPYTLTTPKALVPVAGVPMLDRIVAKLRAAGIDDIVVNAYHFADQIVARAADLGFAVSLEEGAPLETGGGIRHAAPLLASVPTHSAVPTTSASQSSSAVLTTSAPQSYSAAPTPSAAPTHSAVPTPSAAPTPEGRFLVHNVDILSNLSIPDFIASARPEALATLLVVDKPADRYLLFREESGILRLVGWTNVKTGEVKSPYPDLDPDSCRRLSFCGVHLISEAVFPLMASWPDAFGIIDFYLSVCANYPVHGVLQPGLRLVDIGTPETLVSPEALALAAL